MTHPASVPERVLEAAVSGIAAVETGRGTLDDYLDFELRHPELRRTVGSLLFLCFRHRKAVERAIDAMCERAPRPGLRRLLAAALTQMRYQTGIAPESAANVAVAYAKRRGGVGEGRFVNALLRRSGAAPFPDPESPEEVLPDSVLARWRVRFPEETMAALTALFLKPAAVTFRAERAFDPGEIAAEALPARGGFRFFRAASAAAVLESEALRSGSIYLQDPATSLAPSLPEYEKIGSALDLCAAPGGKSLMMAERLAPGAELVAADRSARRQRLTEENFRRRGLRYPVVVSEPEKLSGFFDLVLADVPCSNTGVFRRRPDALWRFGERELAEVTRIQRSILEAAAARVAPGGQLVYSTCSIEPEENELQVAGFLARHPEFARVRGELLLPSEESDGAYACLLRRSS